MMYVLRIAMVEGLLLESFLSIVHWFRRTQVGDRQANARHERVVRLVRYHALYIMSTSLED